MRSVISYVIVCWLILVSQCVKAEDSEESIAVDKLPVAVQLAVKKAFPRALIDRASTEKEDDETHYEVELTDKGRKIDVTLEADGEIEEIERSLEMSEVPSAVSELVAKKYPKSTVKTAEGVYELEDGEEELEFYKMQVETADKKMIEVKVKYEVEIINGDEDDEDE